MPGVAGLGGEILDGTADASGIGGGTASCLPCKNRAKSHEIALGEGRFPAPDH